MIDVAQAGALAGGALGAVGAAASFRRARSQNRRDDAEAANVTGDSYRDLIGELRNEVTRLRRDVDEVRDSLRTVTNERDRLRDENTSLRARVSHLEETVGELSRRPRHGPSS